MDDEKDTMKMDEPAKGAGARPPAPGDGKAPAPARRKAAMAAACAIAAAAIAVGIGIAATSGQQQGAGEADAASEGSLYKSSLVEEKAEQDTVAMTLSYEAPGRIDGATPAIARIQGTTEGNRAIDYYHAMSAASEEVRIVPGTYTVSWVSIINPDGSIERASGAAATVTAAEGASAAAKGSYEHVSAEDVEAGELERIVGAVADAVKKGDESLKGDAGRDAAEKAASGAKANPKADASKVDDSKKAAEESASQPVGSTGSDPTGSAGAGPTEGDLHQPSSASSGSAASSAATSQASAPAGQQAAGSQAAPEPEPAAPAAHEHSWAAHTETRQCGTRTVVDREAWVEPVYETQCREICNGCGADITADPHAHIKAQMLAGNYSCGGFHSVTTQVQTGTNHHDAETHEEPVYETVTTWSCSCGATK